MAATGIALRFEGLAETARRYRALADSPAAVKELAGALYRRAESILAVAKGLVPVDTGNLRSSGHVAAPIVNEDSATVEIIFGGSAAPYALFVHENLRAHHKTGQAKYLETAVIAEREGTLRDLVDAMRAYRAGKRAARSAGVAPGTDLFGGSE